jgi:S-adenosylmethionine decarboxylase proenzyme
LIKAFFFKKVMTFTRLEYDSNSFAFTVSDDDFAPKSTLVKKTPQILGKQTMLELYGCATKYLNDIAYIEKMMLEAAKRANATVVQQFFHQFSPFGVSGTVVIAESHINIHTWPEHDFAAVDLFTCGTEMEVMEACNYLTEALEAQQHTIKTYERGDMALIQKVRDSRTLHHRQ